MTATRDRRNDPAADASPLPWGERPIAGPWRGIPWWAAVLIGFGLAGLGAIIDMQAQDELGLPFQVCYFLGCVAAICAVRRRNVFGPMVQPPLILGIIVPSVVLVASGLPESSDTLAVALAVGTPLINGFPTMAITTVATLAVGLVRIYRERDPNRPLKLRKATRGHTGKSSQKGSGTASAAGSKPAPPAAARGREQQAPGGRRGGERGARGQAPPRRPASDAQRRDAPTESGRKPPTDQQARRGGPPRAGKQDPRARPDGERRAGTAKPGQEAAGKQPPGKQPQKGGQRGGKPQDDPGPPQRQRRPSGQQGRSGPAPPPKGGAQPPKPPEPGRASPPPRRPRPEQDEPPRRQPRKRPWE